MLLSEAQRGFSRTYIYATRFRGLVYRLLITYMHVCTYMYVYTCMYIHVCAESCSHLRPLRNAIRSVQLCHKEPSHASCIYYSCGRAADHRILALFALSPLFLSSVLFFYIFYSALNISRVKRAIRKHPRCTPRMNMRGNFTGPTRSACAIFTVAIARPLLQLFPVKCYKAKFPDHVVSAREPRPGEIQPLDVAEL